MNQVIRYFYYKFSGHRLFLVADSMNALIRMIPGGKAIRISLSDKQEVCIAREGNRFYSFVNKCPHQGLPLHQGTCSEGMFTCPFHRHCFDLKTGKNTTFIQPETLRMTPLIFLKSGIYLAFPKSQL